MDWIHDVSYLMVRICLYKHYYKLYFDPPDGSKVIFKLDISEEIEDKWSWYTDGDDDAIEWWSDASCRWIDLAWNLKVLCWYELSDFSSSFAIHEMFE